MKSGVLDVGLSARYPVIAVKYEQDATTGIWTICLNRGKIHAETALE